MGFFSASSRVRIERPEVLEKRLEQVRSLFQPRIVRSRSRTICWRSSTTSMPGRNPQEPTQASGGGLLDRELVLELEQRLLAAFRHETVVAAEQVNRHAALRQIRADGGFGVSGACGSGAAGSTM